jgi:hypothetical protein
MSDALGVFLVILLVYGGLFVSIALLARACERGGVRYQERDDTRDDDWSDEA